MLRWIPYVMVRIAIVFSAGILIGIFAHEWISEDTVKTLYFSTMGAFILGALAFNRSYWRGTITGFLGLVAVLIAGYLLMLARTESRHTEHIIHSAEAIRSYSGIASFPEEKTNSTKVEIEIKKIFTTNGWKKACGRVLVFIVHGGPPLNFSGGDQVIIKGSPSLVQGPQNPGEFDYRRFLSQKNILFQQRITPDHFAVVSHNRYKGFLFWSQTARSKAAAIITKYVAGQREQAITTALVLGVADAIDSDLQDAYSASGAMHVLSVSGLHVGIIYAIILLLLKPIRSLAWGRWAVAIISLLCLWCYAFITGLSPSVLRAVMMFSFVVVARPFGRNTNIFNTLAASGFLLLICNPYLIMSVGFQLSYLAVFGIVYLQRPLYHLWEPKSIMLDKLWQITAVSIAAQLATFAAALFYFHQFPVYFLISNLLVIPLSTAVLVAGIALLAVSPFEMVARGVAWITEVLVKILNGTVFYIEGLPLSIIRNVHLSAAQCWLLMLMTITTILFFKRRKLIWSGYTTMLGFCFGMLDWTHYRNDVAIDQFVVYNIARRSVINTIDHGYSTLYGDSLSLFDKKEIKLHVEPFQTASGVREVAVLLPGKVAPGLADTTGFRLFLFNRTTVVHLFQAHPHLPDRLVADYLVVSNNAIASLDQLKDKIQFKELILTADNSRTLIDKLMKEGLNARLKVYSVLARGAFVIKL